MTAKTWGGPRKGAGRPKGSRLPEVERGANLTIRATPVQRAAWEAAADTEGLTLAEWMRDTCDAAASGSRRSPKTPA
jgi:hypothetical protein